ncbi:MAG: hypothetical protein WC254_07660, partial [Candidatus Woesearchaeota archaeon]
MLDGTGFRIESDIVTLLDKDRTPIIEEIEYVRARKPEFSFTDELPLIDIHIPNTTPLTCQLDVAEQEDITDLIVSPRVKKLIFNPTSIRIPEAFYKRLPAHLKDQFQQAITEYVEAIGEKRAFAQGWEFLWK